MCHRWQNVTHLTHVLKVLLFALLVVSFVHFANNCSQASNIELSALHYKKTYTVKITEKAKGKKGARRTGKIVFVADPQCNKVKRNEC